MKRFATFAAAWMGASMLVHGQQSITAINSAVNQDFNGMGTSTAATLPTGWRVGSNWASGTTTTSTALGTSGTGAASSTSTSAGAINWAYGTTSSTTDRALGFRNGNASTGARNLVYAFRNDTAATIRSINLGWKYEKYISGTAAMSWTFFHGSSSTASNGESTGDQAYVADANNSTVSTAAAVITETVSLTNLSITPGATYYLRWTYNNTATQTGWMGQGLALDDFSITFVPTIHVASSMTSFATTLGIASAAQSFTYNLASAASMTVTAPTGFEVSRDGIGWSSGLSIPASSVSGLIHVRIASSASAGTISGNLELSSPGVAQPVTLALNGTVTRPNNAPSGADKTIRVAPGGRYTLLEGDWGFSDALDNPPNKLKRVILGTVASQGVLQVAGENALDGQAIDRAIGYDARTVMPWGPQGLPGMTLARSLCTSADGLRVAMVTGEGSAGLAISTNGGLAWMTRVLNDEPKVMAASADLGVLVYAFASWPDLLGEIRLSTDLGATWTGRTTPVAFESMVVSADGQKIAGFGPAAWRHIYVSVDSGQTWVARQVTPMPSDEAVRSLAASRDLGRIAALGDTKVYLTTNLGEGWVQVGSVSGLRHLSISTDGSRMVGVPDSGDVHVSTDFGATWSVAGLGFLDWAWAASSGDGSTMVAAPVFEDQGLAYSLDAGKTWQMTPTGAFQAGFPGNWGGNANYPWPAASGGLSVALDGSAIVAMSTTGTSYFLKPSLPPVTYEAPSGAGVDAVTFQVVDDGLSNVMDLTPNSILFDYRPVTLSANPLSLTGFSSTNGLPSASQAFSFGVVDGMDAVNVAILQAAWEVSSDGINYATNLVYPAGTANGTVHVRMKGTAPGGSVAGTVTVRTTGAASMSVSLAGTMLQPTLAPNFSGLTNFVTVLGTASVAQNIPFGTSSLYAPTIVTAPPGWEISLDGAAYQASVSIPSTNTSGGILVRISAGATVGNIGGNPLLTFQSTGATMQGHVLRGTLLNPITTSTSLVSGFSAVRGSASASQSFTFSVPSLSAPMGVTCPNGWEVSSNGTSWGKSLSYAAGTTSGRVWVRIGADAAGGLITGVVTLSGSGLATQSVSLSGEVLVPLISLSTASLTGFSTFQGSPSGAMTFGFTGANLPGATTATSSSGWEISTDGTTYSTSVSIPASTTTRTIYVRIAATASAGALNGSVSFVCAPLGSTPVSSRADLAGMVNNRAPAGTSRSIGVLAGSIYTFADSDWGFADPLDVPSNSFAGIRLANIPGAGQLRAGGVLASVGQEVTGNLWTARDVARRWSAIAASLDGVRMAAAVRDGSIYTSLDGGATWAERGAAGSRAWSSLACSADGTRLVAAVDGGFLYVSVDGGGTWAARLTDSSRSWRSVASSTNGLSMVAVASGDRVFRSVDGGATWGAQQSLPAKSWRSIACSADGARLVAAAASDAIYVSTNGGNDWASRATSDNWVAVASSADGQRLLAVPSMGKAMASSDAGVTWSQVGSALSYSTSAAMSSDGTRLVAVTDGQGVFGRISFSSDSGASWRNIGPTGAWKAAALSSDGALVAGVMDNGTIFTAMTSMPPITYAAPTTTGSHALDFHVMDDGIGNNTDPNPKTMRINVVSIVPATNSLAGFTAMVGSPSTPQPLPFACAGLVDPLTLSASDGWEISLNGGDFQASLSYPATTTSATAWVRMRSMPSVGSVSGMLSMTSGGGSVVTVGLAGSVSDGPRITAQPASTTVASGRTAVLTVTATSTSGPMTYQWRKGGVDVSNGARVSGATTSTLTLSGVEASDAGQYTVEVRNTAGPTLSDTATLSVVPFNNPPTLGTIGNVTRLEDSTASMVALAGIGDGDGGTQALTVTATSSNPSVVLDPTVTYTPGQATGSLALNSPTNANGTATITVRVQDNGGTVSGAVDFVERSFVVTVTPVNDPPTLSAIGNVTLLGTGLWTAGSRSLDFGTAISGGDAVRGSASRTTTGNGEVTLTTTAGGQTGSFALADFNPGLAVRAFRARFRLLIDAGGNFPAEGASFNFMGEDPATASMATAELGMGTGLSVGFAVGGTPAVVLRAGNVEVGRTNYQAHGVGTLSAMPWVEVTLFHDRTVSVLHNGVLLFDRVATTLQPTAGWRFAWSARTSISGSARHVIDDISVSTATAAASVPVPIAGVSDGDGGGQALTVTATTSNATLLAAPTVQYTSPQATGALVFAAPVTNVTGAATITVRVEDNGGIANGGVNFATRSFQASVVGVNRPPTLDAVANQRVDSGSGQEAIVNLTGIGTGGEPGQAVTLSATSGNTSVVSSVAVEYTPGATMARLRMAMVPGASGTAVVYVTAKDDGGTDNLGWDTSMRAFTVTAGVLPPVIVAGPTHRFVEVGQASTLTVSATGFGLGYKWFKNGVEVGGATAPSLTIPSMSASDAATYRVQVSNSNPEGVNPTAEVHVGMVSMPARQAARAGAAVTLSAQVTVPQGVAVTRQWLRGDQPVTGGAQDALTLSPVGPANVGDYALRLRMGGTDMVTAPVAVRLVSSLPGLFSTGVDDSGVRLRDRQEDTHYTLVSPSPVLGRPVAVVTPGQFPMPPWFVGGATSAWISPTVRLREAGSDAGTLYTYRTSFDLTGIDLGSVRLAGGVAADDGLVAMRLNGVDLPLPSGVGTGDLKVFDVSVPGLRGADRFADRGTLPAAADAAGSADTTGASMETGEELPGTASAHGKVGSVWWRWVAPTNGLARVSSTGSAIPVILAVYRGRAMGSLTLLGSSDGGGADAATERSVQFAATAGQEYHLYMDGYGDAAGLVRVEVRLTGQGPTGHDNFASRGVLPAWAWRATAAGTNVGATYEAGEPVASGTTATEYHTLWWTWTAPASGEVTFDTIGSEIDTVLWVYTGTAVGSLTQVTSNDDIGAGNTASRAAFTAVSGTSYHLRVDGKASATGALVLNLTRGTQPMAQEGGLTVLPGRNDLDFVVRNLADAGTDRSLTGLRVELGQSEAVVHPAWVVAGPVGGLATFGTRKALSVSAVSAGATQFQWYKNDAPLDGANEATLEFNRLEEDDAGRYRVRVDNLNGTTWSDPVDLAVDVPLTITQQPVDQAVVVGGSASFGVRYRGNPPFAVQWMFNGQPIAGATSATLTISPAALSSEGVYRAAVTDREGSVETDEAVLRVMQPPLIVQQPGDMSGVEGVATLRLEAVVDGTEPLQYRWFRNDVPLAVASGPVLDLGLMRESQEGAYRLVATNLVGAVTSRVAQVTVNQRPSVVSDTGNQNVNVGEDATFAVTATGSGTLVYRWHVAGTLVPGASQASMTLSRPPAQTGTEVMVVVSSDHGSATNKVRLDVFPAPEPVVSTGSDIVQMVTLRPGWNAVFLLVQPEDNLVGSVFTNIPYTSVWRWSDPGVGPEFIADQSEGQIDFQKWQVFLPPSHPASFQNNLVRVFRHEAYLVNLGGTQTVTLTLSGKPAYMRRRWISDGYTLTGFPVEPAVSNPDAPGQFLPGVTLGDFIASSAAHYDAAAGAPRGVYRLGASGAWTPMASDDELREGEAYWVYTRGASQFIAPLELSMQGLSEITFGVGTVTQELEVRAAGADGDASEMPTTISHGMPSQSLPLQVSEFNPSEGNRWRDLQNGYPVQATRGSVRTVRLAAKRERIRDLSYEGVMEVRGGGALHRVPLRVDRDRAEVTADPARPFNPVGLWVGSVTVTHVSEVNGLTTNYVTTVVTNVVDGVARRVEQPTTDVRNVTAGSRPTPVRDSFEMRVILHVGADGVCRLLQQATLLTKPTTGNASNPGGEPVLLTSPASSSKYQGVAMRGRDLVGRRFSTPFYPMPGTNGVPFDSTLGPGRTVTARWALPSDAALNPFKHRYHPDHDNLDASFRVFREEAYPVRRTVRLRVPERLGSDVKPGMGQDELQGEYEEVLEGLHRIPITVRGTFHIKRLLAVADLDPASP